MYPLLHAFTWAGVLAMVTIAPSAGPFLGQSESPWNGPADDPSEAPLTAAQGTAAVSGWAALDDAMRHARDLVDPILGVFGKSCVLPADGVTIVGPRYTPDGADVLEGCGGGADGYIRVTQHRLPEGFANTVELQRWCQETGQFQSEHQRYAYPTEACLWSFATKVRWLPEA